MPARGLGDSLIRNAVCLCTDRNMVVPALFVASEAARRARGAYDVYVIAEEGELQEEHLDWMAQRGIQAMRGLAFPRLHRTGATAGRIPPASLIRLVLAELLAQSYHRLLYLDCDTELCGDPAPLFELDLQGRVLAAAPAGRITASTSPGQARRFEDHGRALGMTPPYRCFNDGVMLIDIALWNKEGVGERALEFIERNPEICRLPDEDALNAVLDGHILDLSPIWNLRADVILRPGLDELLDAVVRHYDGPQKPWKRFAGGRRLFAFEDVYQRYRRFVAGTPWREWLDRQTKLRDLFANLVYEGRFRLDKMRGRRRPDLFKRSRLRRMRSRYRDYLMESAFADVEQGIVLRNNGRLILNPAKVRP